MTWLPHMTSEWKKAIRNKRKYAVRFAKKRILSSRRTGTLLVKTGERPLLLTGPRNLLSCLKSLLRFIKPFNHLSMQSQKSPLIFVWELAMVQLRVTKPRQHNYLPIFSPQLPLTSEGIMLITYHRTITNSITAYRPSEKCRGAQSLNLRNSIKATSQAR